MKEEVQTVGQDIINEIERVAILRQEYLKIPTGFIAASMMQASIDAAKEALNNSDVIAVLRAYEDLKGFTD